MLTVDLDKLALAPGQTCLDVGCGEGRHTLATYLLEGVRALGIDLSERDLGTARQRIQDMTPHCTGWRDWLRRRGCNRLTAVR